MISYLVIKTIIRLNKIKMERFAINNVSLKDISNIIREFEDLPYEGYVRNRPKHMPTKSYFYLAIHLVKCMARSNFRVFPVRTHIINTQDMNNSETSAQKIPNFYVCSSDNSE